MTDYYRVVETVYIEREATVPGSKLVPYLQVARDWSLTSQTQKPSCPGATVKEGQVAIETRRVEVMEVLLFISLPELAKLLMR